MHRRSFDYPLQLGDALLALVLGLGMFKHLVGSLEELLLQRDSTVSLRPNSQLACKSPFWLEIIY
jgi:hypothetical protein